MRFWDAVMASVAFWHILRIGRRLAGPICGFTAVLLLFTYRPLIFDHGLRMNNMEASVFLAYAAGMYHFLAWRRAGPDARGHVFAMALYFVLGFMTKFVAALFLPFVLVMAVVVTRESRLRLWLQWPTFALAALVALALTAPWFIYQYVANGPKLFETMFSAHVVKRFTAYLDPVHLQPWHYYFTELWTQLRASGSLLLVLAGTGLLFVRVVRRRWFDGALLILWFGVPMILISFGTSKLSWYAYPFLPPVALAGGYAAASVARWIWHWVGRPVTALLDVRQRLAPRFLSAVPVQSVLGLVGVAGLSLAGATCQFGRLAVDVGGIEMFRNSSVARPLAAGALALATGGPAPVIRAVPPAAAWLGLMPITSWRTMLALIQRHDHPFRDLRDCLATVVERGVANGQPRPGVWVEGHGFTHRFAYYLYNLGPWEQRDIASDGTVAMHLFAPNSYRPVLLENTRYSRFIDNLGAKTETVLAQAARHAEMSPDDLMTEFHRSEVGVAAFAGVVQVVTEKQAPEGAMLLLPGPYSGCAGGRLPSR
jgi:4-amino-4-deoxy-L-arabinose transferase-like glycosyltransferase